MSINLPRRRVLTKWAREHLPEPRFQVVEGVVLDSRSGEIRLGDHTDATWWEFNHNRREVPLKGAFGVAEIAALEARIHKVWSRELAKVADPAGYHIHGQLEIYELDYGAGGRGPLMPYVHACYGVRCFRRAPDDDFAARALAPPGDRGWCRLALHDPDDEYAPARTVSLKSASEWLAGKLRTCGAELPADLIAGGADTDDRIGKLVNRLNSPGGE